MKDDVVMIKTVVIGAGGIATIHVSAINRLDNMRVVGVIDVNPQNAQKLADMCGAKVISKLDEVLDEIDMIHLLTPPSKRVEYAEAAMKAGKHVLCEKPIASNMDDANILAKLAKENGVLFMTAFNMRFRPGYLMMCDDIKSGRLGDIISVWSHRTGPGSGFIAPMGDTWRTNPDLVCGMSVESLSHDIDMFRGFGLEISDVSAWVKGTNPQLPQFDNNAQIVMGLKNGGGASINASWSSYLPMCSRGIIGTRGTSVISGRGFFDFMEHKIKTADMKYEQATYLNDPFNTESYYSENKYFAECIEKCETPFITVENGLEALRVSLAILQSAKDRQTIRL